MTDSITLGRISGIRIGLNWSWFVVFGLIVWTLDRAIFPRSNPGLADSTYAVMAVVAAVVFFLSLLLHELGHAIQARRDGMEIDGITLWLFGGVAKFKGMFPSAGAEFRIAVAGPAVSLVLGVAFVLLAWLAGFPSAVEGTLMWLGRINLILLGFNLLPALPLDGGRVLRSALWHFKRDFASATHLAAGIGRGFGYFFIAAGLAFFFFQGGAFGGAWLAFIGWFLLMAAGAEDRALLTRQTLGGLRVRDLMIPEPVTASPDQTIGEFLDKLVWRRNHTTYPVVQDARAVGLLPFRRVASVPRAEWDARHVRDCMIPLAEVPVLGADDELVDAAGDLQESDVRRGLVLDGERLVGLLSLTDVARAFEVRRRLRQAEAKG